MLTPAINSPKAYPPVTTRPEKEWTVLYVFNGDNDLKENTSHQFMDVVKNGAPDDSYVATFCARGDLEWAPGNIGRKLQHTVSNLFRKKKSIEVPSDWEGNRVFVVDPKGVSYLQRQRGGVARVAADGDRVEVMDGADGVGAPLLDFSGAVAIIAASTSGGELLTWAPSGASPEDLPEAQITTLDEPPLAMWSEPHALTLVSRAGTVIKLRCSL